MGRRTWPRRLAWGALAVVGAIALTVAGLTAWSVRRPFPDHDGSATLAGLDAPVDVLRDDHGVPHLYAATSLDLYRAQGYVHAQDRFWQMDVWRHITGGRTAELFGPDAREGDRFLRALGWHRLAEEEYELLGSEERAVLQAYAEGVNAYLGERSPGALGLGYTILRLQSPGYAPEPWEPTDTLAFLNLMAWDLGGNMDVELQRVALAAELDDDEWDDLFPPYPENGPRIVRGDGAGGEGDEVSEADGGRELLRRPEVTAAAERVAAQLEAVEGLVGPRIDGIGSNSWVLSGERTASGAPILANDPHMGIGMPSTWYEVGLHCEELDPNCPEHISGFSFAGAPGVVIGHNDRIAWGFTNLGSDVQDLYLERVDPDDPTRYEVEGEWRDMEVRTETLRASDGSEEELEIRSTRNGPIISDLYGTIEHIEEAARPDIEVSLRWTGLEPASTFSALLGMNRARDWEEFREATSLFHVPAQNMVYADVDGRIGYQAPGRHPIRADGHDGSVPVPGWDDDYQWQGYIPFDDLPHEVDPERGWIVTANNAVVTDDYPYPLNGDWDHGYRATRIEEIVDARHDADLDEVAADQLDSHDPSAEFLVPRLLDVDADGDERIEELQALLADWDLQATADSQGAAAYQTTWRALLYQMFGDRLPDPYKPVGGARWFEVMRQLLDEPDNSWWGDDGIEPTLATALATAHDELTDDLGSDPGDWTWGRLHTATFVDPTLGESGIGLIERLFNRGPYEAGGGASIVNATSWDARQGYEVIAAPSMRMVVDLADLDRTRTIHTTGQSGHPYHGNYTDMVEPWQDGEQRDAVFSRDAVEAAAEHELRLRPTGE